MKLSLDHFGIVASEPARTIDFYVRLLDGRPLSMGGHTVVAAGDVRIAVVPRRPDDPEGYGYGHHLALRAAPEEREAILARLAALGAPHQEVRGRIYTRDPDGLTLELTFEPS